MLKACVFVPCLLHCITIVIGSHLIQRNQYEVRSEVVSEIIRKLTVLGKEAAHFQNSAKPNNSVCSCVNYTCGCCLHLEVPSVNLNHTACVNVLYLSKEVGIEVDLTLDGRIVFRREISAKNPPAVCAEIPYVHNLASLCVRFYNLSVAGHQFSGCVRVEVELEHVIVRDFDFGCFHIPPNNSNKLLWTPEKGVLKMTQLSRAKRIP